MNNNENNETQMTLGALIDRLESFEPNMKIVNLHGPHSYYGSCSDLAFEMQPGTRSVKEILGECKGLIGSSFKGHLMGPDTPIWLAYYGFEGDKIVEIDDNGGVVIEPEEW